MMETFLDDGRIFLWGRANLYFICCHAYVQGLAEDFRNVKEKMARGETLDLTGRQIFDLADSDVRDAVKRCYMKRFTVDFTFIAQDLGANAWYYFGVNRKDIRSSDRSG